ncbi:MAG: hypothetical protein DMG85_14920, partial [Acidobacteria bacterium]
YPAGEQPIPEITGAALARRIAENRTLPVKYVSSFENAATTVIADAQEGDMILTLGAGSVSQLGPMIIERLQLRGAESPTPIAISQ